MTPDFSPEHVIAMLRRSYGAVDGLWFVMCEERLGFEAALELDDEVWQVMPKIQARKAREVLGLTGNSLADLAQALSLKLTAEGHEFEVQLEEERLEVRITRCPWHEALVKADRLHMAEDIARQICGNECQGWAKEFGREGEFAVSESRCAGGEGCGFVFR